MNDPHIAQGCSAPLDGVAGLSITDGSLDFGDGAVILTCDCGAWAVEDGTGAIVAWSESVEVAIAHLARTRELSGAA